MAIKTVINYLWPKLEKQSEFAKDIAKICSLISDCISMHHPLVLEIRYLFCLYVSGNCWGSREKWEGIVKGYNYSLPKFANTIREDETFRKRVIQMLESEKLKLIESAENGDNSAIPRLLE